MKIGMPILYEYDKLKDNFDLAKKLELDFVELNLNFGYCRKEIKNYKELLKLLKEYNLELTLHFYDDADFGYFKEITLGYMKILKKYLALCSKLKVKILNIHLNYGPFVTINGERNYIYEKEYSEFLERLIRSLNYIRKLCNKYHIILVIENVELPKYLLNTYKVLAKNNFFFNFDIGHDFVDGSSLLNLYSENKSIKFKEMHIHNSDGKKNHLSLKKGIMDISKYKKIAIDNDSYVVIEVKKSEELLESINCFKEIKC